jgi:TPR repeat protein
MRLKASYLLNDGDMEGMAAAHTWFVESARRGNDRAMFQAGLLADMLGNQAQATYWFTHAAGLGNQEALQRMGYLRRLLTQVRKRPSSANTQARSVGRRIDANPVEPTRRAVADPRWIAFGTSS